MRDPDEQRKKDAIALALRGLGEHFDHVQIMVSWNEQASCYRIFEGSGNWYARQGMAHEFIKKDDAQVAAQAFDTLEE
jgi:hypothetical protein